MMKFLKKSCYVVAVMLMISFGYAATVSAADCASASIKKVGVNPTWLGAGASNYFVQLDCSNNSTWAGTVSFYLSADLGDSGLATMLTAYSLNKTVWVRTGGTTPGSLVTILYMND